MFNLAKHLGTNLSRPFKLVKHLLVHRMAIQTPIYFASTREYNPMHMTAQRQPEKDLQLRLYITNFSSFSFQNDMKEIKNRKKAFLNL